MPDDKELIIDIDPAAIEISGDKDSPAPAVVEEVDEPAPRAATSKISESDLTEAIRLAAEAKAERDAAIQAAEAERAARLTAEQQRDHSTDQAARAYWDRIHTERTQIDGAIALAKSEMDRLESAYQAAFDAGDGKAAAAAQREMSMLTNQLASLDQGKSAADVEIEKARRILSTPATPVQQVETPPPATHQEPAIKTADDWINQFPRKTTGGWLKDHKDYVTDPEKHKQLIAFATEYAQDYGQHSLHSADFVAALNERFDDEATEEAPAPKQRSSRVEADNNDDKPRVARKASTAAPVSRAGNYFSSRNMNGSRIKLPPHIADFVKQSGLDPVKYAEGLVADVKAGKLPKNYLDADYQHEVI